MKNIGDFLSKFKIIRNPAENRGVVSNLIKEVTGVFVSPDAFKIQKGIVYLQIHPAQRNIIYIKKEILLEKIQAALPDLHITNII